jgi:TolB-like protein
LLILLAEKDGHVVTRQEIIERLWGKDVFVDTEHGINTAVRKIRTALREDGERPRYVQTVLGKGYRLVTEHRNGNTEQPATAAGSTPSVPTEAPAKHRSWRAALAGLAGSVALAGILIGLNVGRVRDRWFAARQQGPIRSIAVLPLVNLSGDPSQDYFADGMTDELITMLARYTPLRVVSRTTAMQFKGVHRPLRDVAQQLGVDAILEGSIERSQNRVHMTVQLVRAKSDSHIWAQSYNRDVKEIFSLSSDLAQTIAKEVKIAVSPVQAQRYVSPEAHDAYLHGLYFLLSMNLDRSQEYFEKAIKLQPDYAAAWSGLAGSYGMRAQTGMSPLKDIVASADAAAHKAVELDDSSAEAHTVLGATYLFEHWDWEHADEELQRAIELNPNNAEVHQVRAHLLLALNRLEEGLQEQRLASEMDPFAQPWTLGWVYILTRHCDAAIKELRAWAETEPQVALIHMTLSAAYDCKGMEKEAAIENINGIRLASGEKAAAEALRAFEKGGRKGVLEWELNEYSKPRARKQYVSPYFTAMIYALLRRKEEALRYLEEAYREHCPDLVGLQNVPAFDFLHSEPRYRRIVNEVGLPPAY